MNGHTLRFCPENQKLGSKRVNAPGTLPTLVLIMYTYAERPCIPGALLVNELLTVIVCIWIHLRLVALSICLERSHCSIS